MKCYLKKLMKDIETNIKVITGAFVISSESIGKTTFGIQQNIKHLKEFQKNKVNLKN